MPQVQIILNDPSPEQIKALFGVTMPAFGPVTTVGKDADPEPLAIAPEGAKPARKAKVEEPAREPADPQDAELAREMAQDVAEAAPEPVAATAVVDAGTGKPIAPVSIEELRANATRLAQKDTPALAALLKQFGAAKLSEVPEGELPAFNAAVVAALG